MAEKASEQKRSKHQKGGGRNREHGREGNDTGFGYTSSHLKRSEKYNPSHQSFESKLTVVEMEHPRERTKDKKTHKMKFVNLYSDGRQRQVIKLPGRHECECQSSLHGLVNNCLKCGRIVCEQEGSGPCYFCGSLVCSKDEQKILDHGGRKAEELRSKLILLPAPKSKSASKGEERDEKEQVSIKDKGPGTKPVKAKSSSVAGSTSSSVKDFETGLEKARAEKDRLLDYQQNSARRTMVYDDESDYFDTNANSWLTKEERQKLRKREQELRALQDVPRSQRKIMLDLGSRQVIEDEPLIDLYDIKDSVIQEVYFTGGTNTQTDMDFSTSQPDDIHRPGIFRPMYNGEFATGQNSKTELPPVGIEPNVNRLQDGTLQSLRDQGRCLSMHQPYASLLVKGIKKHEGRSWYTTHRGPLWIASTARHVPNEEIQEIEQFYRLYYNNALPTDFPSQYPSSCLLGCVDVVDCLAQEQYRELYPEGESESPYVWICENPRELSTHFPIRGQHKIYKLDSTIHQAAKRLIGKERKIDI